MTIKVGTAGIGRMQFKAWLPGSPIDRQDDNDNDTYDTPGEALAALGRQIDKDLISKAWFYEGFKK